MKGYSLAVLFLSIGVWAACYGFGSDQGMVLRWVFAGMVAALLFFSVALKAILGALPIQCELRATNRESLSDEALTVQADLQRLGFEAISRPMVLNLNPPVSMIALRESSGKCFAIVYNSRNAPNKTGIDFVTLLDHSSGREAQRAMLTTGVLAEGGTLPIPDGSFMQLFPDADPKTLFRHHVQAMQFLAEHGVGLELVTNQDFRPALFSSISKMRTGFLKDPVWNTLIAVVRTFTKWSPYRRSISSQPAALKYLGRHRRVVSTEH